MLRLPQAGHRAGDPGQPGVPGVPGAPRAPRGEDLTALGDLEQGQGGALRIGEHHVARILRDRFLADVEGDGERPGRPVVQRPVLDDRRDVRRAHEPGQRRERPGQQQLQIPELSVVQRQGRHPDEVSGQIGLCRSSHVNLRSRSYTDVSARSCGYRAPPARVRNAAGRVGPDTRPRVRPGCWPGPAPIPGPGSVRAARPGPAVKLVRSRVQRPRSSGHGSFVLPAEHLGRNEPAGTSAGHRR